MVHPFDREGNQLKSPSITGTGETVADSSFTRKIHLGYPTIHTSGLRAGEPQLRTYEIKISSILQVKENGAVTVIKPDDQAGFWLKGGPMPLSETSKDMV